MQHQEGSQPLSKRELVELEILNSERNYSREINIVLDVFIRPLRRHASANPRVACLTQVEASVLECSLEKVLEVSKQLLRLLEDERSGATQRTIGRIFLDEAEQIRRAYVDFVSGYRAAVDLYSDLMNRAKRKGATCSFHTFMKNCAHANDQFVGGRIYTDFMILPVQRVPRYRLLLESLLKRVTGRFDKAYLKEAIKRVSLIADEMNYRLRKMLNNKPNIVKRVPSSASDKDEEQEATPLGTIQEENEEDDISHIPEEEADITTENGSEEEELTVANDVVIEEEHHETIPHTHLDDGINKEEAVEMWLERRNWKGEDLLIAPTANSFALYALATKGNPWKASELSHMNAASSIQFTLKLYSHINSPPPPFKPTTGDILVVGPIRSGQTPVLQVLQSYSNSTFFRNPHSILNHVGYVGWEDWQLAPLAGYRLLKSHMLDLKAAFGGHIHPALKGTRPEWRIIVTLRNPLDLRLSFFRHVRRVFRKMNPEFNFDRTAYLDEFASCLTEYEDFIAEVLKVVVDQESPQVLILFYEEMLADPARAAERLADFINFVPEEVKGHPSSEIFNERTDFVNKAVLGVTTSPFYVGYSSRVGSSHQGRERFSRESVQKMDADWDHKIRSRWSQFPTYEKLFCFLTKRETYPCARGEDFDDNESRGTLRKSRSFSLFNRSRTAGSISRESSFAGSEDHGIWQGDKAVSTPRGLFGRLSKAFSFASSASEEGAPMTLFDRGTGRNKDIDPDDSDEEVHGDLLDFWGEHGDD